PSGTFAGGFEAKSKEILAEKRKKLNIEKLSSSSAGKDVQSINEQTGSITYESFLRFLEKGMGNDWIGVALPEDQKHIRQGSSPGERIEKWFSSLLENEKQKFTKNEK